MSSHMDLSIKRSNFSFHYDSLVGLSLIMDIRCREKRVHDDDVGVECKMPQEACARVFFGALYTTPQEKCA